MSNKSFVTLEQLQMSMERVDAEKQDALTFDTTPTAGSSKPVTSGGVKTALDNKSNVGHTHDQYLTEIPSEYVTETELAAKGYLTAVPSEYITETELTAKNYLTAVPSEYVTETELTAKGYATEDYVDAGDIPIVSATSSDGVAYTATVTGYDALTKGKPIIIIPSVVSASLVPTLNVNGLGAKNIRCRTGYNTTATQNGPVPAWLGADKPIMVYYDGTYWVTDMVRPDPAALTAAVPINRGGTGQSSITDTTYTTARYRASALYAEASLVDPTVNGVINWSYK